MWQMDVRVALVTAVCWCSQLHLVLECGQTHDLFVTNRTWRRRWDVTPPIMTVSETVLLADTLWRCSPWLVLAE